MSKQIDLGLNVLDHQLLDSEERRCGKADDLALEGNPGEQLELVAILSGPGVWRARAGRLGRIASWIGGGARVRVPWEEVDDVRSHILLRKQAQELGLGRGDDRLRPWVSKVPGSDH